MTDAELIAAARKALEGTPHGPWVWSFESVDPSWSVVTTSGGAVVANVHGCDGVNARFIAAARDLVPMLADRLEALVKAAEQNETKP